MDEMDEMDTMDDMDLKAMCGTGTLAGDRQMFPHTKLFSSTPALSISSIPSKASSPATVSFLDYA